MRLSLILKQFKDFRQEIYNSFSHLKDATMDLVDALSGNLNATSVVQLSLNPAFRRKYGSVRNAIRFFNKDPEQALNRERCLIGACAPPSENRAYRLFVLDATPAPREHSQTLEDKSIIYKPTVISTNKPITIGHQFSVMGFLPEKTMVNTSPWLLALSTRRIATHTKATTVGLEQLDAIMPAFSGALSVLVADSGYGSPDFIAGVNKNPELISIIRLKSNRVFNHEAAAKKEKITGRRQRGHALWYGEPFKCKDEATWGAPDEVQSFSITMAKSKNWMVEIQGWDRLLMRQKKGFPLPKHPFRILRIIIKDENNKPLFRRAMWLMVCGQQRNTLSAEQCYEAYKQRYDIEHFFKFGKRRLLMDKFQTPDTTHEESWWQIVMIAHAQLYMARELVSNVPKPWEKYLKAMQASTGVKSPRQVQNGFSELTREIGTPAAPSKPRGKPLGRAQGELQKARVRHPVIFKAKKGRYTALSPPKKEVA